MYNLPVLRPAGCGPPVLRVSTKVRGGCVHRCLVPQTGRLTVRTWDPHRSLHCDPGAAKCRQRIRARDPRWPSVGRAAPFWGVMGGWSLPWGRTGPVLAEQTAFLETGVGACRAPRGRSQPGSGTAGTGTELTANRPLVCGARAETSAARCVSGLGRHPELPVRLAGGEGAAGILRWAV